MANTIKIKRGNNANLPSLNEAELAFTTDTKQLYAGTASGNKELFKDIPFPTGGLTGELLVKKSDADYDAEWKDLLDKVVYKRRIMVGDNLSEVYIYSDIPYDYLNVLKEKANGTYRPFIEAADSLNMSFTDGYIDGDATVQIDWPNNRMSLYNAWLDNGEIYVHSRPIIVYSYFPDGNVATIDDTNESYRHLFIKDPNIRPIQVGDVIGNGTKFYFTFPDDLYTDARVDWSSQIFNTTGSSGFIYMSMGHMGDDYTIYGYFANTAMETIYQYTNSSITNKSFITCGSQAVGEVDSVNDYLGKYVLVDKRTLGNNARKLDITLDNLL